MEIKYDKKIDAKYVRIKKGKIAHTKKEREWLLFDCAKNGSILGVEILNASRHPVSIHTVGGEFIGCGLVESARGSDDESLRLTVKSPEHKTENLFLVPLKAREASLFVPA